MTQQINLFNYLPRNKPPLLTKRNILLSYVVFILLLVFADIFVYAQKKYTVKELAHLNASVPQKMQQLTLLTKQYPISDPAMIGKNLNALKIQQQELEDVIALLDSNAVFSSYLTGLAEATVPGVWLTQMTFQRGENAIILRGYVSQPEKFKSYFANLARQRYFANITFQVSEMKQTSMPASFILMGKKTGSA